MWYAICCGRPYVVGSEHHRKGVTQEAMSGATATWNSRRGWDLSREPNLTGADLRRADLPRADLSEADLARAELSDSSALARSASERSALGRSALRRSAPVRFGSLERSQPLREFQVAVAPLMASWVTPFL